MAEELTRSLTALAERGDPRGAAAVLEDARAQAVGGEPTVSVRPTWRRGAVVAFGTAIAILVVVGATILIARPFGGEETPPATTGPPVVPTTIPVTLVPGGEPGGSLNDVADLALAPDGHLWAATAAGVVRWDTANGGFDIFTEEDGIPAREVMTVAVAPDGVVWTAGDGWIARYDDEWRVFAAGSTPLDGGIGALAVDHDGVVWVAVASEPIARFDGSWAAVDPLPDLGRDQGPPVVASESLAVGPDGTLWVGTHDEFIFAFDGSSWHHYDESDGAPQASSNLVVTADGSVWVGDPSWYDDTNSGIARFDGAVWESITVEDGLLSNEGDVFAAPGGTVWVVHDTGLSRFDGVAWTTTTFERPMDGSLAAAADAAGTLWVAGADGLVGFEGMGAATRLAVPEELASPAYTAIVLTPIDDEDPQRVSTIIGDFEFSTLQAPLGHPLFAMAATPDGPIAFGGNVLRRSIDGVSWEVILTGVEGWITSDGADLIVYDEGYARYSWDGAGWVAVASADLPGRVQGIAFGPNSTVALVDNTVYYSKDGVNFAPAEVGPDRVQLGSGQSNQCQDSWPSISVAGPGNGPILVTETGYVLLTPASSASWADASLCEPVVWFASEGDRWELLTPQSPFGPTAAVLDIAVHDGRYVAVGATMEPEEGAVWVSTDGIDWQRSNVELEHVYAIAGGDLGWFLTGRSDRPSVTEVGMWFSSDGLNWDGPYEGPEGLEFFYFRTEPSVGSDAIFSVNATHDGLVVGRLQE